MAMCYEKLNLPLLVVLIRQLSFLDFNADTMKYPKINEISKVKFNKFECTTCHEKCYENFQGNYNLVLTESIINSLKDDEMKPWIKVVNQQFQEYF